MEKATDALEATLSELISQDQGKGGGFTRNRANDARIRHGLPEDVLYLGFLCADYKKYMISPQMKKLFSSIGVHLCLHGEDEGEGSDMLFYVFLDPSLLPTNA